MPNPESHQTNTNPPQGGPAVPFLDRAFFTRSGFRHSTSFYDLNERILRAGHNSACQGTRVTIWSKEELEFLGKTAPSRIERINAKFGTKFTFAPGQSLAEARALAESAFLTIDNSIIRGVVDPAVADSKINNLKVAASALGLESAHLEKTTAANNFHQAMFQAKLAARNLLGFIPQEFEVLIPPQGSILPAHREPVLNMLGDHLTHLFLHGSSVKELGNDIDLIAAVKDLTPELYQRLVEFGPQVKADKPISIILFPASQLHLAGKFEADEVRQGKSLQQVFGNPIGFPVFSASAIIANELAKAGKELRSLRAALVKTDLFEKVLQTPALLDYILKLEVWIARALLQVKENRRLSKQEVIEKENITPTDHTTLSTRKAVLDALIAANLRTASRIKNFLKS